MSNGTSDLESSGQTTHHGAAICMDQITIGRLCIGLVCKCPMLLGI